MAHVAHITFLLDGAALEQRMLWLTMSYENDYYLFKFPEEFENICPRHLCK